MKTLTIREVENGYIINLSSPDDERPCGREYVVEDLPESVKEFFDGNIEGKEVEDSHSRWKRSFEDAEKEVEASEED